MNRLSPVARRLSPALCVAALLLFAGCGRSGLIGNGGVDEDACFGPGCANRPDLAGIDIRLPDLGDAGIDGFVPPPPPDFAVPPDFAGWDTLPPPPPPPDLVMPGDMTDGPPPCSLNKEICSNGIDDNCNGLIDCKDPQCAAAPGCFKPGVEICNNGIDDNDNTLVDCKDPDCANFPGCRNPNVCDPVNPNCADPACVNEPKCQNLACTPTVSFGHLAPKDGKSTQMVNTVGTKDVTVTPCGPGGGGMVVTDFYLDTAASSVRLDFTQSNGADHVFGLFRAGINQACNANPINCFDPKAAPSGTTTWVLQPGHYYLIVQSFTKQHQGTLSVTLTTPPSQKAEVCNNGVDDDGNGLIDCKDPACTNDPACKANICNPDLNVGAIVVGTNGQRASISTVGKPANYSINCGGKGGNYAVQFSLKETAGIGLDLNQLSGDHIVGLYRLPPLGTACDQSPVDCLDPSGQSVSIAWGEFPAGQYLFIFKAVKPGNEGDLDIRIYAYKNRAIELCHNGIDDDGNGLVDCADTACVTDPGCGPPVCMPDIDLGTLNIGDSRSTQQNLKNGIPALTASCAKGGGRSRVIQLTLAKPSGLTVSCTQLGGQAVVDLMAPAGPREPCDAHELSCADPNVIPFGCNYEWPNMQAGTYYIMLQAFQAGAEGTVNITLGAVNDRALEVCNNNLDDDGDGFADCADKKCATSVYCSKKACKADQTIDPMPLDGSMVTKSLDTTGKAASTAPPCVTKAGGGSAVVALTMPAQGQLTMAWLQGFGGGNTNHVFALYPNLGQGLICDAGMLRACVPSKGAGMGITTFANVPAGKYWLVVAADQPGTEGPLFLNFTAKP